MKLLLLSTEYPPDPGGIGTHARHLALGLSAIGWEVHVLATQLRAGDPDVVSFNDSEPYRLDPLPRGGGRWRRVLSARRLIKERARELGPFVALATGARACVLAAGSLTSPWIAVGHGSEFAPGGSLQPAVNRWAYGRASHVVPVSRFTQGMVREAGIHARGLTVIHNGADETRFRPPTRRQREVARGLLDLRPEAPVLLTVGSVTRRKGQQVLVRALPSLIERWPELIYLVVGTGIEQAALEGLAARMGVSRHLRCLGAVPERHLDAAYHASDLFCMTSTRTLQGDVEGFGIAVIEGALAGLPAVVSDSGGLPEAVEDGESGVIVPEGDSVRTAEAVAHLLESPERRIRMATVARERALAGFTWPRVCLAFDALLRPLVSGV